MNWYVLSKFAQAGVDTLGMLTASVDRVIDLVSNLKRNQYVRQFFTKDHVQQLFKRFDGSISQVVNIMRNTRNVADAQAKVADAFNTMKTLAQHLRQLLADKFGAIMPVITEIGNAINAAYKTLGQPKPPAQPQQQVSPAQPPQAPAGPLQMPPRNVPPSAALG